MNSFRPDTEVVRVLLSLDPPNEDTRYVNQISSHMDKTIELLYFSWVKAIFGSYDVFHVHWPEFLIRANSSLSVRIKRFLFRILIARLRSKGTPVIRTLHNPAPHEGAHQAEAKLLDSLDMLVDSYIRLNAVTSIASQKQIHTIMHGDYVERFSPIIADRIPSRPGTLLTVGLIRPYKGILELIEAMDAVAHQFSLRVVGKPVDAEIRASIEKATSNRPQVTAHFGFVTDRDLVVEISKSECVVLPYREIHNSGMLLVALSVGRPVLATRSDTTEQLQREVGSNWLQLFDGEIHSRAIESAIHHFRSTQRSEHPTFIGRTWECVAEQHRAVYLQAHRSSAAKASSAKLSSDPELE